ncbi:MAG: nucleotide exchange factor GrpE [Bacteroidota bacterium]|nr:nucleotide exchange factor GrpE [Bacteroidota bacterium]MDP3143810.1 nucleotide exchange factor GrpE [Bacteroidota bacterium]MDP3558218.1 nucleotide exchange factor GrpE [Bacteroidota bacterium]
MQDNENSLPEENLENIEADMESDNKTENSAKTDETSNLNTLEGSEAKIKELNERYLRLYSEFDNYRKRTVKEKSEIIKTAAEDVFKAILPLIDDLDRAIKANENVDDINTVKEGFELISHKFKNITQNKGLIAFESIGETFDADIMEAITHIPAANEAQKGKVIDEVEKGYKLGDKVIRFAKVVIAQ